MVNRVLDFRFEVMFFDNKTKSYAETPSVLQNLALAVLQNSCIFFCTRAKQNVGLDKCSSTTGHVQLPCANSSMERDYLVRNARIACGQGNCFWLCQRTKSILCEQLFRSQ